MARLRDDDRGATVVEYTLLLTFIALVCFMALEYFGGSTGGSLSRSNYSMYGP